MRTLVFYLLLLVLMVAPVSAHQSSFSYATLKITGDGKGADYEIRLSTKDLFEALALEDDRDATDAEIVGGKERLIGYVFDRIELRGTGEGCDVAATDVRVVREGERFAQVMGQLRCQGPVRAIELQYALFFDLDPRHEGLLTIDGELVQFSSPDRTSFRYEPEHAAGTSVLGFFRSGVNHVVFGLDHILFLLSLLLVVGLRQDGGVLRARTAMQSLKRTAAIVSAFTVGHSLTLIVAALGWVELPSRFVESMIAASIVYVAIENLVNPDPPWRVLIGFGFGLMHGMGFAAMLRPLLPPEDTVLPLLVFNLGVEVGQMAIVCLALPVLYIVIHRLGPARYRDRVLPVSCVALSLMGLLWLAERALELELIGL